MPFSQLEHIRLKIHYQAQSDLFLTDNRSSTFAGLFKSALRQLCCTEARSQCRPNKRNKGGAEEDRWCHNVERCLYAFTAEHVSEMGEDTVLPYLISTSGTKQRYFRSEAPLEFELLLMGPLVENFHAIIAALAMWESYDLSRFRAFYTKEEIDAFGDPENWPKQIRPNGRVRLAKVEQILPGEPLTIYEHGNIAAAPITQTLEIKPHTEEDTTISRVKINFTSPVQFKKRKQIVKNDALDFNIFYHALSRRFTSLVKYFGSASDDPDGEQKMLTYCHELASGVRTLQSDLKMEKIIRGYDTKESYEILKGEIIFENLHPCFTPWIKAGEIIHVGKFPTLGFGQFRAEFF